MILLSDVALILYDVDLRAGVQDIEIKITLSAGTYSIDGFNAKIKLVVSQLKQNWEVPQIKDLNPFKLKHYTFMAFNNFLTVLGILDNYFETTTRNKSTLPPGAYKTSIFQ